MAFLAAGVPAVPTVTVPSCAAGVIMALWLNLVGITTRVPTLDRVSLIAHLVWGTLLWALVHSCLSE